MKNVLITSAGRRVALLQAFAHELSRNLPAARVIAADANPDHSAACQIAAAAFQLPRLDHPAYSEQLLQLCQQEQVGLVVPTIDTELQLLADNRARFADAGIAVVVSASELVRQCRHKGLTHELFSTYQIPVPASIDPHQPRFPVFVKPVDGSSSQHIAIARNHAELRTAQQTAGSGRELLYLELVDPSRYAEFTVDLYYNRHHQLCCVVPRRRIEVRAGEVSKGITEANDIIPFLRERIDHLPGAVGCLTLQLFRQRDGESILGIEINPRFGGGYPLTYRAGASFPDWLIREYLLDQEIDWFEAWEDRLLMLRFDEGVFVRDSR